MTMTRRRRSWRELNVPDALTARTARNGHFSKNSAPVAPSPAVRTPESRRTPFPSVASCSASTAHAVCARVVTGERSTRARSRTRSRTARREGWRRVGGLATSIVKVVVTREAGMNGSLIELAPPGSRRRRSAAHENRVLRPRRRSEANSRRRSAYGTFVALVVTSERSARYVDLAFAASSPDVEIYSVGPVDH